MKIWKLLKKLLGISTGINWSEWENLTEKEYRVKWDSLNHEDRREHLYNHIAVIDPINIRGTEPGQELVIHFWLKANEQHYLSLYYPESESFIFSLHGKITKDSLNNILPIIRSKLLKKIANGQ